MAHWTSRVQEENRRLRRLRLMVDFTMQLLYQDQDLTLTRGLMHIRAARDFAESLFPGKGKVFDLVYKPRLLRVLQERGLLKDISN